MKSGALVGKLSRTSRKAAENSFLCSASDQSQSGSFSKPEGLDGSVSAEEDSSSVGRPEGGDGSLCSAKLVGLRNSSSIEACSAKLLRRKDSFEVFSKSRRTK